MKASVSYVKRNLDTPNNESQSNFITIKPIYSIACIIVSSSSFTVLLEGPQGGVLMLKITRVCTISKQLPPILSTLKSHQKQERKDLVDKRWGWGGKSYCININKVKRKKVQST